MRSADIRRSFIDFFRDRGHREVPSSSLVPLGDPTLLFTNAGMVQFKRVFQGLEQRDYKRAVSVQKCVRAGGKHNDLEEVGLTSRHHTFFEMLGNFSFGDYFKKEAFEFGWEWITSEQYLGIDPERIYISVHEADQEARRLALQVTGLPENRIFGLSDEFNFWQMGDTGPCGPCGEIYVDLPRTMPAGGRGDLSTEQFVELAESGAILEIWNLVFMEFDQAAGGAREPLPAQSVDTGAGLERIASVMQDVDSNFHTDLFMPVIRTAEHVLGREYDRGVQGVGFRVLADHARAVAFLLADGVYPSHEGRGYVLRRILRRAVRHAYLLGRSEPTLARLTSTVIDTMGDVYPELVEKRSHIEEVTLAEEERFLETIADGLRRLDAVTAGSPGMVSGAEAFKLYDTYGFPLDLTQVIARERGWGVDTAGFDQALTEQQERSRLVGKRQAGGGKWEGAPATKRSRRGKWVRVQPRKRQRWVGYETTRTETDILAFRKTGDQLELILHENPFYAESGGQVSDTGVVKGEGWELPVEDVERLENRQAVVGPWKGDFEPTAVEAIVAERRRHDIERNHTATHLVHAALQTVLGTHVRQAGSVVAPDRLRFDFSHHAPATDAELRAVEQIVNEGIWQNALVEHHQTSYDEAIARGAMALFGEKYGDRVRLVEIPGLSLELCGGTHVRSTGQIGSFQFTSESGVAAGVRRIEAVTGPRAYRLVKELDARIGAAADVLRTTPEHLARKIEGLLEERRRLERQIAALLREEGSGEREATEQHRIGDVRVFVSQSPVSERRQIGVLMDKFRERESLAVKILFTGGARGSVHVAVTDDLISRGLRAGELAARIAALSGGRGGGRPHFASGGIADPEKLEQSKRQIPELVRDALGALTA